MSALTKEQIAALPGMVARLGGHDGFAAWDASDSLRDMATSLAATVIEQQAETERLREALNEQVFFYAMELTMRRPFLEPDEVSDLEYRRDRARAALEVRP